MTKKTVLDLNSLAKPIGQNKEQVQRLNIDQLASGATLSESSLSPAPASEVKAEKPVVVRRNKIIRRIPESFFERIKELKEAEIYRLSANDFFLDAVREKLEREERKL